jgi:hypothetical protein
VFQAEAISRRRGKGSLTLRNPELALGDQMNEALRAGVEELQLVLDVAFVVLLVHRHLLLWPTVVTEELVLLLLRHLRRGRY